MLYNDVLRRAAVSAVVSLALITFITVFFSYVIRENKR